MSGTNQTTRVLGGVVLLGVIATVVYFIFMVDAPKPVAVPEYRISSMQGFAPGADTPASMRLRARDKTGKSTITLDPKHELRLVISPPDPAKLEGLTLHSFGGKAGAIEALLPRLKPNADGVFEIRVPGEKLFEPGQTSLDLHFLVTTSPQGDPATNKLDYTEARRTVNGVWLNAEVRFELL